MTKQRRHDNQSKGIHLQRTKTATGRLLLREGDVFAIFDTKRAADDHLAV